MFDFAAGRNVDNGKVRSIKRELNLLNYGIEGDCLKDTVDRTKQTNYRKSVLNEGVVNHSAAIWMMNFFVHITRRSIEKLAVAIGIINDINDYRDAYLHDGQTLLEKRRQAHLWIVDGFSRMIGVYCGNLLPRRRTKINHDTLPSLEWRLCGKRRRRLHIFSGTAVGGVKLFNLY